MIILHHYLLSQSTGGSGGTTPDFQAGGGSRGSIPEPVPMEIGTGTNKVLL